MDVDLGRNHIVLNIRIIDMIKVVYDQMNFRFYPDFG